MTDWVQCFVKAEQKMKQAIEELKVGDTPHLARAEFCIDDAIYWLEMSKEWIRSK